MFCLLVCFQSLHPDGKMSLQQRPCKDAADGSSASCNRDWVPVCIFQLCSFAVPLRGRWKFVSLFIRCAFCAIVCQRATCDLRCRVCCLSLCRGAALSQRCVRCSLELAAFSLQICRGYSLPDVPWNDRKSSDRKCTGFPITLCCCAVSCGTCWVLL